MVLLPGASLNDHVEEEQMFPGGPTQETDQTVGSDLSPLCLYPPQYSIPLTFLLGNEVPKDRQALLGLKGP